LKRRVLFLCATNSLYSPMAEALLRLIDSRNFEAYSAGVSCHPMHPLTIEVMKEIGIDLGLKTPRLVAEVRDEAFDFVITLDEIAASQQDQVTAVETVHWKFDNPLAASDNPEIQRRQFRTVRDQMARRLRLFAIVHVRPGIAERNLVVPGPSNPAIQVQ
jgi:protein-tyrosine-phosphatase